MDIKTEAHSEYVFRKSEIPWLEAGMRMLADSGAQQFSIDALSKRIGISRTSFYHLFGSVPGFIIRLCQFWTFKSTISLFEALKDIESPGDRLKELVKGIKRDKVEGEVWIRLKQIGRSNEQVNKMLKDVEVLRLKTLGKMIESLGYSQDVAKKKARVFMYYYFGRIMLEWSEGKKGEPDDDQIIELFESIGIDLSSGN